MVCCSKDVFFNQLEVITLPINGSTVNSISWPLLQKTLQLIYDSECTAISESWFMIFP